MQEISWARLFRFVRSHIFFEMRPVLVFLVTSVAAVSAVCAPYAQLINDPAAGPPVCVVRVFATNGTAFPVDKSWRTAVMAWCATVLPGGRLPLPTDPAGVFGEHEMLAMEDGFLHAPFLTVRLRNGEVQKMGDAHNMDVVCVAKAAVPCDYGRGEWYDDARHSCVTAPLPSRSSAHRVCRPPFQATATGPLLCTYPILPSLAPSGMLFYNGGAVCASINDATDVFARVACVEMGYDDGWLAVVPTQAADRPYAAEPYSVWMGPTCKPWMTALHQCVGNRQRCGDLCGGARLTVYQLWCAPVYVTCDMRPYVR